MSVDFGYFRRGRRSFLRTTCQRSSYKAFPITSIVCICHFVAVRSPIALSLGLELNALRGTGGHVTQHPRVSSALVGGVFNSFRCCSLHVRPACGKNRHLGRRVHAAHLLRSIPVATCRHFRRCPVPFKDAEEMFHVKRLHFALSCGSHAVVAHDRSCGFSLWIHHRTRQPRYVSRETHSCSEMEIDHSTDLNSA